MCLPGACKGISEFDENVRRKSRSEASDNYTASCNESFKTLEACTTSTAHPSRFFRVCSQGEKRCHLICQRLRQFSSASRHSLNLKPPGQHSGPEASSPDHGRLHAHSESSPLPGQDATRVLGSGSGSGLGGEGGGGGVVVVVVVVVV